MHLFSSIILRCMGVVCSFAIVWLVAQVSDSEEAGQFFFYMSFFLFSAPLTRFGMDETLLRVAGASRGNNNQKELDNLYKSSVSVTTIGFISLTLLVVVSEVFGVKPAALEATKYYAPTLGVIIAAAAIYNLAYNLAKVEQGLGAFNFSIAVFTVLPNLLIFLCIAVSPAPLADSAEWYFLSSALLIFCWSFLVKRRYRKILGFGALTLVWSQSKTLFSVWISVLYAYSIMQLPVLIFGSVSEAGAVAGLAILLRFAAIYVLLASFVGHFFAPKVPALKAANDLKGLKREVVSATITLGCIGLAGFAVLVLLFEPLLSAMNLDPDEFFGPYLLMNLGFLLHCFGGITGTTFVMVERVDVVLKSTLVALSILVCGILIFGSQHGLMGAVISVGLAIFTQKLYLFCKLWLFFKANSEISPQSLHSSDPKRTKS